LKADEISWMPKIKAGYHFGENENKVSATPNKGFSIKRLNRDIHVFGVSGEKKIASKNKSSPPRT